MRTAVIVDADPGNAKLLAVLLETEGWLARIAYTPDQALALLTAIRADVILLEIVPLQQGLAFVEKLRSERTTRSIPIVLVSSFNGDDVEAVVLEAGCRGYIKKPVDVTTFTETLDRLLGENHERHHPSGR